MGTRWWNRVILSRRCWLFGLLAALSALLAAVHHELILNYRLASVRRELAGGDAQGALATLVRHSQLGNGSAEWQYTMARVLRRCGHLSEAQRQLLTAKQLGWNPDDIHREALLLKARQGHVKQVEPELVGLLESGVNDEIAEEVYEALAQGYWTSYYVSDALQCLEFWSDWQPKNLVPKLWIADLYRRSDKPNAAIAEYEKILELEPEHPEALAGLGELLLKKLEIESAADTFSQCLAIAPETPDAMLGLADCRRRQGLVGEVRDLLYETLTLDLTPLQASQALATLGTLALEDRNYAQSVRLLQQSLSFDGNDPATHISLAAALTEVGETELAAAERERGREISDRHARLMRTTSKAVEEPDNAELRCEAGLILMEQGFWAEGADWIKTAIEIDPRNSAAHEGLAKFYEHTGDLQQAKRHHLQAQEAARLPTAVKSKDG